jgi:two-component system, LytTR family, sensor histidine kinase LytS
MFSRNTSEGRMKTAVYIALSLLAGALFAGVAIYLNIYVLDSGTNVFFFLVMAIFAAAMVSAAFSFLHFATQEEHNKAEQSQQILEITSKTLPFLRKGLNYESAENVVKIIHDYMDAMAVSITGTTTVLAFYGVGSDHHLPGKPILTRSTREAIEANAVRVVSSKFEIGCPMSTCKLRAAIVVPLQSLGKPIGVLKFYYDNPVKLTENRIAVAEGLGLLLSTQIEVSELDRQRELAVRAELRALQAQINPHFLFNTLNTITSFIRTDPQKARKLLVQFSDFFRKTLEWREGFITLAQELDYIANYLVLERARFGDRLVIDFDVDFDAHDCILPALTIQPLVENAVKHGFSEKSQLEIEVVVKLTDNHMNIEVVDNGKGIADEELDQVIKFGYGKGSGIGLSNVNERLKGLYGKDYELKITSTQGEGTTISFMIPISRSEAKDEHQDSNS